MNLSDGGSDYFTGSWPPRLNGLHRAIRQHPSAIPRMTPYFDIAWTVYSEQDGWKRHTAGRNREVRW